MVKIILKNIIFICFAVIIAASLPFMSLNVSCEDEDRQLTGKEAASPDAASSQNSAGDKSWFTIQSGYMTIYCNQDVDLKAVAKKLSRRGLFTARVYDPNPVSAPAQRIAYMLDRLLKRAKEILDMWPANMNLNVRIYKDREALSNEYGRIFGVNAEYKAFYIFRYNTIYISEEDMSDSVIAHEMGHAIVDHYFSVIPPEKIREMLASYVDVHLEGE